MTSHNVPAGPHVWYQDPIGDVITGTGVVALGIGAGFYIVKLYGSATRPASAYFHDIQVGSADQDHSVQFAIVGGVLWR